MSEIIPEDSDDLIKHKPSKTRSSRGRPSTFSRSRYSVYRTGGAPTIGTIQFQPTYRLEPQAELNLNRINNLLSSRVRKGLVFRSLDRFKVSNIHHIKRFCSELAADINMEFKIMKFDRYRHIVVVEIVQKSSQSGFGASGFLWDVEWDQWASYTHEMPTFILCATVFFVYRD